MKKRSAKTELKALVSILDSKPVLRNQLLTKLKADHISYEPCIEIYERILWYIQEGRPVPSVRTMIDDPAIGQRASEILKSNFDRKSSFHPSRLVRKADIDPLVEKLEKFRRQRFVIEMATELAKVTQEDNPDHDLAFQKTEELLLKARTNDTMQMMHGGVGQNVDDMIDQMVDPDAQVPLLRTGFPTFDQETGGFARGNLVFWVANYGGGKSVTAMQYAMQCFKLGYKVLVVSLEMDDEEYWARMLSNLTGIDHELIKRNKMDDKQRRTITKAKKWMRKHGKQNGARISTYCPGSLDPWEMYSQIKPYGYDIVIVDYVGLMKAPPNTPGDERIKLGEIARVLKIIAGKQFLNCVMVTLAQLNDEDKIKYARAMAEHANFVLWWRYGEKEREFKRFVMHHDKARNAPIYSIDFAAEFEKMRIVDLGKHEKKESKIKRKGNSGSAGRSGEKRKRDRSLGMKELASL